MGRLQVKHRRHRPQNPHLVGRPRTATHQHEGIGMTVLFMLTGQTRMKDGVKAHSVLWKRLGYTLALMGAGRKGLQRIVSLPLQ